MYRPARYIGVLLMIVHSSLLKSEKVRRNMTGIPQRSTT